MADRADLTDVPALTLLNPWAHLIAHGGKNVENRSWMPHEGVSRLLVHAGTGWQKGVGDRYRVDVYEVTTAAIVAVADLSGACSASRWTDQIVCSCGKWAMPGQCHWRLGRVRALPWPMPAVGRQGLWQPPPEVREAVSAQFLAALEGADRGCA